MHIDVNNCALPAALQRRASTCLTSWLTGLALLALLPGAGCSFFFDFNRDVELAAGDIEGRLVREDKGDEPANFARVLAQGVGSIRRADADGRFRINGLAPGPWVVQIADDEDGDGWPERSRIVPTRLSVKPHDSGLFGEEDRLDGVSLGDVAIDGTARVSGRVLVGPPGGGLPVVASSVGAVARLIVTRDVDVPALEAGFDAASLAAEAQTAADDEGNFVFTGVGTGLFYIVPVIFSDAGNGIGQVLKVGTPVFLRGFAGDDITLPSPIVVPDVFGGVPDARTVQLNLSPPPAGGVYMMLAPPGSAVPPCALNPPASSGDLQVFDIPDEASINTSLPPGIFDIYVCVEDVLQGELFEQPIPPPDPDEEGGGITELGTVLLRDAGGDLCELNGQFDCDGDANPGLPKLDGLGDPNVALWIGCVAQCQDAFGEDANRVLCTIDGQTFDCDDDGDGQPDVTESQACYGLGKGTDLDGDGLCSGADPFPQCTANTAEACEAGVEDFRPPPSDEYEGGLVGVDDGRPFDRTFGEGGFAALEVISLGTQVRLDSQGRVVVAGIIGDINAANGTADIGVWRYLEDGTVDAAFGEGGLAVAANSGDDVAFDLAIDGTQGIYVVGNAGPLDGPAVWRFLDDGTLDPTFNAGTQPLLLPFAGDFAQATGVTVDGPLVYVVGTIDFAGANDVVVWCFEGLDGTPNNGFGSGGQVLESGRARAITALPGEGVFVGGDIDGAPTVWAFDNAGLRNALLNQTGIVTLPPIGDTIDEVTSIVLDSTRSITLAGLSNDAPAAWSLLFDGTPLFGETGGVVLGPSVNGASFATRVALDSLGRAVVTGTDLSQGAPRLGLWRLETNGGLDTSFASGQGFVSHAGTFQGFEEGDELGLGVAVDNGGSIFVAGMASLGSEPRAVTWRFLPDAPLPEGGDTQEPPDTGTPTPVGECGNNVQDPGEDCDDGNLIDGDGCSSQCTSEGGVAPVPDCQAFAGEPLDGVCEFFGNCAGVNHQVTCNDADGLCDCREDGRTTTVDSGLLNFCGDLAPESAMVDICGFTQYAGAN